MRIVVQGLWHLGSVTAACLAEAGLNVTGLDPDAGVVGHLREGQPPLHEPGLPELVRKGMAARLLSFSTDPAVVAGADLVWVAFDTPVDDEDRADPGYVERQVETLFPFLRDGAVVLISSQLPVGSTRRLATRFSAVASGRELAFAYSPENLRLGKAIEVFDHPERIIVGTEDRQPHPILAEVLGRFSDRLVWMSLESAEMVKHALNAFLATSVTFINEIASIAEKVGAQASDVEEGLKSEARIGRKAYLKPGAAFAGGTLARDVVFLGGLADHHAVTTPAARQYYSQQRRPPAVADAPRYPTVSVAKSSVGRSRFWAFPIRSGPTPCAVRPRSNSAGISPPWERRFAPSTPSLRPYRRSSPPS